MLALLVSLAAAAAQPARLPSTELPGLERRLRWGMPAAKVAGAVRGFEWLGERSASGHGTAAGRAEVAGRPATLVFQFGRDRLAVVTVLFDLPAGGDGRQAYADLGRLLRRRLGRPDAKLTTWPGRAAQEAAGGALERWRVRGSELTHALGVAEGRPRHVLHLVDARRPDHGEPAVDYALPWGRAPGRPRRAQRRKSAIDGTCARTSIGLGLWSVSRWTHRASGQAMA